MEHSPNFIKVVAENVAWAFNNKKIDFEQLKDAVKSITELREWDHEFYVSVYREYLELRSEVMQRG